jgi:hypothetical protein
MLMTWILYRLCSPVLPYGLVKVCESKEVTYLDRPSWMAIEIMKFSTLMLRYYVKWPLQPCIS